MRCERSCSSLTSERLFSKRNFFPLLDLSLRPMHQQMVDHVRAHAHALVKLARSLSDEALSEQLERLAIELLQKAHSFEKALSESR